MLDFLKNRVFPTGIDLGSSYIKAAQLGYDTDGMYLQAAACEKMPGDIEYGSGDWQRWALDQIKRTFSNGSFKGKEILATIPSGQMFIDQVKVSRTSEKEIEKSAFAVVQEKLPFDSNGAMVKYVHTDTAGSNGQVDVLVMAAERMTVNKHLAIYEKAGLRLKGISVWPMAMASSYTRFFGRRAEDERAVVMLVDIGANHGNVVICKHKNLLFARVISAGYNQLNKDVSAEQFMSEIDACWRYYESLTHSRRIERLIFLASRSVDKIICENVAHFAQKMQVPAQIGDVLAAIQIKDGQNTVIDRRGLQVDWATTFGLSLSGNEKISIGK
jgi:Tfp pilus assembly PilM family ATPase